MYNKYNTLIYADSKKQQKRNIKLEKDQNETIPSNEFSSKGKS
jgi:hypothetical protein